MSGRRLHRSEAVVRCGELLDGTGRPPRAADVLVVGERVAEIAPVGTLATSGRDLLDARGTVVAPGFVDVHSHGDNAPLLAEPDLSKLSQGVTTQVVGNCGFSLAPVSDPEASRAMLDRLFPPTELAWRSFAELFSLLDDRGYVVNYAPLAGHHALRTAVMGPDPEPPSPDQQAEMGSLLDEALEAGVFGLSSGLIYPPGCFAAPGELSALVARLPSSRVYASHVRNEGAGLEASLEEALETVGSTGVRLQISHLKAAGRRMHGRLPDALSRLVAARHEGIAVAHDAYPYTHASTTLTAVLPPSWHAGGDGKLLGRLAAPGADDRLREALRVDDGSWQNFVAESSWADIRLASTGSHRYEGTTLAELAGRRRVAPERALVELLVAEQLRATMIVPLMDPHDVAAATSAAGGLIGSDGLPPGLGGLPHPRSWGTFARILERQGGSANEATLSTTVRQLTDLPARRFGLPGRGRVAPGYAADLVSFRPGEVRERASFEDPCRPASGFEWVMVQGRLAWHRGEYSGVRSGSRLCPPRRRS